MTDFSLISKFPIFYISPDIKRALGLESALPNFHIICSYQSDIVTMAKNKGINIFCLGKPLKNTSQLLSDPRVIQYIKDKSKGFKPNIIYFKPNLKADQICEEENFKKLVNNYELNEQFENKVVFYETCLKLLPENTIPGLVGILGELQYEDLKANLGQEIVVQFGHGWAGKTTFFIKDENEFSRLQTKYPFTTVKVTRKIDGITMLNNCVIYNDQVIKSPLAIQLNGIKELSHNKSITCGRMWPVVGLKDNELHVIDNITEIVGRQMMRVGYRGYFGLDFIVSKSDGKVYLSENNARFTASTPFFTKLELEKDEFPLLLYHIAGFLGIKNLPSYNSPQINGSQIIVRNDKEKDFITKREFPIGIYKLENGRLKLKKQDYDIRSTKKDEFIVTQSKKGIKIKKDGEITRIETKEKVLIAYKMLSPKFSQIVNILKSN
ncbi:hypothetical protein HYW54_00625 [Candidatus Gottesmanbacteria bacterium]|nr:hypothetical protein [Candidatus Gottesmanbacteria bacterium]